jgi:hypothetical protein
MAKQGKKYAKHGLARLFSQFFTLLFKTQKNQLFLLESKQNVLFKRNIFAILI